MKLLPFVKTDTGFSIARELVDKFDDSYIKEQLKIIKENNPTIADFITKFSNKCEDKNGSAICGIVVYRLIESQTEANKMKKEIKL
jgi:hypothetical protein